MLESNIAHNYGYTDLECIYDYLEIDRFLDAYQTSPSTRNASPWAVSSSSWSSNGLLLAFQIFFENTVKSTTLISGIREVKRQNNKKRILCVADKGLNTKKNSTERILNLGGYFFSQTLRGPKGKNRYDVLFCDGAFKRTDNDGRLLFGRANDENAIFFDARSKT